MTARKSPRAKSRPHPKLIDTITLALEDLKAVNVRIMDVRGVTDIADVMVIASGNSDRHVRSIADRVVQRAKQAGFRPYGVEGQRDAEWVLVDLQDVVVHVMLPRVREFYGLEGLWDSGAKVTGPKTGSKAGKKPAAKKKKKASVARRRSPSAGPAAQSGA
ncbi:MAG: ribosome silencing factor [Steroidobacteraceae bacterium]